MVGLKLREYEIIFNKWLGIFYNFQPLCYWNRWKYVSYAVAIQTYTSQKYRKSIKK